MGEPGLRHRRLLENHLCFTALHRGDVIRESDLIRWQSTHEAFCCLLLQSEGALAALRAETRAVRTFPWSGDVAPALARLGFREAGALRYMSLPAHSAPSSAAPHGLRIEPARTEAQLSRFSDVQSRSFLLPGEPLEPLRAFLHAANLKNLGHPAQNFYVGSVDGAPAAVTLLLVHEGTAGIYAVATLPAVRRRGLSRALLARAIADARGLGCDLVTLQVHRDSDAERLYRHLGFSVDFDCLLWERTTAEATSP
jgi:GNAT superfamily N-acetyltransferase